MKIFSNKISNAAAGLFVVFMLAVTMLTAGIFSFSNLNANRAFAASPITIATTTIGGVSYHTLTFGEYPQTYVGSSLNTALTTAYNGGNLINGLTKSMDPSTGLQKSYTSNAVTGLNSGSPIVGGFTAMQNYAYLYNGNEYVRMQNINYSGIAPTADHVSSSTYIYTDSTAIPSTGTYVWFEVQPIKWLILNWTDMPNYINPQGNGSAVSYTLLALNSLIAGIPFYINANAAGLQWQNSTIRGYLNGTNVSGGNFTGTGNFLNEAFAQNGYDSSAPNIIPTSYSNANATPSLKTSGNSGTGNTSNTTDQVAVLSFSEAFNVNSPYYSTLQNAAARIGVTTDYARSQNAPVSTGGTSRDWTRTSTTNGSMVGVTNTGATVLGQANLLPSSIRPMINLNLNITLTFSPNGGMFNINDAASTAPKTISLAYGLSLTGNEVNTPSNFGYTFGGWNTQANGSGTTYANIADVPQYISARFYAVWTPINYYIDAQGTVGTLGQDQFINFYNGSGTELSPPNNYINVNQSGYIQTYLLIAGKENFVSFMVLKNNGDITNPQPADQDNPANWVSLAGALPAGSNVLEYRLGLDELIDSSFIKNFGYYDNSAQEYKLTFKAVYDTNVPMHITLDADTTAHRSFGSVSIDGAHVSYNTSLNYAQSYSLPITVVASPNLYRLFAGFDVTVNGTPLTEGNYADGNYYTMTDADTMKVTPQDGMVILAKFSSGTFGMSTVAQDSDGNLLPISLNAIADTSTQQIKIGDTYTNTAQAVTGYNLAGGILNSVKIYNQTTKEYDTFAAVGGEISFANIDGAFLNNYLDYSVNPEGEIVVYVIYIKQYLLTVNVVNPSLGAVTVTSVDSDNILHTYSAFPVYVDEWSTVKIGIAANSGAQISSVSGTEQGEQSGKNIIFTITDTDRTIGIEFSVAVCNINVKVTDIDGNPITEGAEALPSKSSGLPGDVFDVTFSFDSAKYKLEGIYAGIVPMPYDLAAMGSTDGSGIYTGTLPDIAVNDYVVNGSINIIIKLAPPDYGVQIFISNGTYSYSGIAATGSPTNTPLAAGDTITITITPNPYYALRQTDIDGLYDDETLTEDGSSYTVDILIDSPRIISINCYPQTFSVVGADNNLAGARGGINVPVQNVSLGDQIILTFSPSTGYQVASWDIYGGKSNQKILSVNGSTASITVTQDILDNCLVGGELVLSSTVTTTISSMFLIIILVIAIAIPLLLIGAILLYFANRRKKKAYSEALQKQKEGSSMLGQSDLIKKLHDGGGR